MDYQNYNDYMQNILGYSPTNYSNSRNSYSNTYQSWDTLEKMYPHTYRVVYPMVVSTCSMIAMPVTEEMLNRMTNDIYDRAIMDDNISAEIESRDEISSSQNDNESRPMMPHRRNRFFNDFIRVLILRELLDRRPKFPFRPL